MKLLIITTGNEFTPSMLYKENYIIKAAIERGDEVLVIASQYTYINGRTAILNKNEQISGYRIIRLPYLYIFNTFISRKIKKVSGLYAEIINYAPDLIFFNCAQVYDIMLCEKLKSKIPNLKIVLDFSTKFINSARNWLSREILHKIIYRYWIQKALPYVDKVFYISIESKEFAHDIYGIPNNLMEHNNLPGQIINEDIKNRIKKEIRIKHHLNDSDIIFAHSGKMGKLKKTIDLLNIFNGINDNRFHLFIIGSFLDGIEEEAMSLIHSDNRIEYLGFMSGDELTRYICAADMYLQPGTISQTSQTAICCGTPICFTSVPTNKELYNGNGFFIDTDKELKNALTKISKEPEILSEMSKKSYILARKELEYTVLYKKILKACHLI